MNIKNSFPYTDPKTGVKCNRLIVRPTPKQDKTTEAGVILPSQVFDICETGTIVSVSAGSKLRPGDEIVYAKVNRNEKEQYDAVLIENEEYDVLYENEIWSVNEKPWNRLFVTPLSGSTVSEGGVIELETTKGIPQDGTIFLAPEDSFFKAGDTIQYRKQEQAIFATVNLDGVIYDVLWETDIFTVNGKVAPARMIIKFDMKAWYKKQASTDSGVILPPQWLYMKYNLQYGLLEEIGSEAKKHYPELEVGNTVIVHHLIESQKYRLLKRELSKFNNVIAEYRMINSFNEGSREVFGVMKGDNVVTRRIIPFGKNVFMKWNFDLLEQPKWAKSDLLEYDFSLNDCHDFYSLHDTLEKKKEIGVKQYKMKYSAHVMQLEQLNSSKEEDQDAIRFFENGIEQMRIDVPKSANYLNKNHLVAGKVAYPRQIPNDVALPYKELYPIELFGDKYLIANSDYIFFNLSNNSKTDMSTIKPFRERVLILPIVDPAKGNVIIPEGMQELPQKGKVISIGEKVDLCQAGDIVLHRKGVGYPVEIEGETYLVVNQNDLLAAVGEGAHEEAQ